MSFAKLIRRAKEREAGSKKTLIEHFEDAVSNPPKFRYGKAIKAAENLLEQLEEMDMVKSIEAFAKLYELMINARPRKEGVFHPSTLETDCPRMLWYDINKVTKSDVKKNIHSPKTLITFDQGTWFHLYAQINLLRTGVLKKFEVQIEDEEWKISGHMDGKINLIDVSNEEHDEGLEIKTTNSNMFRKASYGVFEKHKKQAFLYGHFGKLKVVRFLYFNKDTSDMKEFREPLDYKFIDPMLKKMSTILEADKAPERTCPTSTCQAAMGCPWRTYCFNS